MGQSYQVTGMSCAHCENAIREELGTLSGVRIEALSAADGRLVVSSDAPIDEAAVIAAIDEAGYQAERI